MRIIPLFHHRFQFRVHFGHEVVHALAFLGLRRLLLRGGVGVLRLLGNARRTVDQEGLRIEGRLRVALFVQIAEGAERRVGGIRAQFAQLGGVVKAHVYVFQYVVANALAVNRPGNLHALVQVARHQVGAAQVYRAVVGRAEAVDAAVLEQPAHDGNDAHVVGGALHLGHQAADAAHEQRYVHARLRRLGNLFDDVLVRYGIGLQESPAGLARARQADLLVQIVQDHGLYLQRSDPQHLVFVRHVFQQHVAEEAHGILAESLVGGDEAEIGVELGRLLVVVARAELRDVLHALGRAPRYAADLGMHLVVVEAVDYMAPGLLEALRPFDVVALVEPCAQLEQRHHLLAVFGGSDKRLGKLRLAGQTVQGNLNGYDVGVDGRFLQQLHERVHGLVGIRQQDVALAYLVHYAPRALELGRPGRREGRVGQLRALLLGKMVAQAPGEAEVQRDDGVVHLAALQAELLQHHLLDHRRQRALAFQAHRRQACALLQQALHVLAVVFVLLVARLVCVDVGVARNADHVGVLNLVHREDFRREHLDGVLQQDELEATARQLDYALALVRQRD